MKIVIEIPKEVYERFGYEYSEENLISKQTNEIILDAFCNGTPLPKGHGALIDESRLRKRFHGVDDAGTFIYVDKLLKEISNAPTIIPADTAD